MELKFGPPKSLEDISVEDVQAHPIWVWVWEAGLEGEAEDETWQCPVISHSDVTSEMTEPVITLRVNGGAAVGSASYNAELDELEAISIWEEDTWVLVQKCSLPAPLSLIAVPTIRGVANVEFICDDPDTDRAKRVA